MVWFGLVWFGLIWLGLVLFGLVRLASFGLSRFDRFSVPDWVALFVSGDLCPVFLKSR